VGVLGGWAFSYERGTPVRVAVAGVGKDIQGYLAHT
jgi:hypothetical protein